MGFRESGWHNLRLALYMGDMGEFATKSRIYLDHAATTPVLPAAVAAMTAAMQQVGNPASVHAAGRAANALLEQARDRVAAWAGVPADRIVFTSGGTEALALAIHGAGMARFIASATEHSAVLAARGDVELIPVDRNGLIELDALAASLARGPALVAIQLANNETGVFQKIWDLVPIIRDAGSLLLCDAVQAATKWDLPDADFVAISAHKLGGPTGVGALIVKDPGNLSAIQRGGGQERGLRGGTPNLPGIAGFAAALQHEPDWADVDDNRSRLEKRITETWPSAVIHGAGTSRLPHISNIGLPGVAGGTQVMALDLAGFMVSAGAACSSGKVAASHVLAAMGLGAAAGEAIRVSLGPQTTAAEVDAFADAWLAMAQRLSSPFRGEATRAKPGGWGSAHTGTGERPPPGPASPSLASPLRGREVIPIYLDHGATTPLDPAVADAMAPWGVTGFGNPHSAHLWGYQAKAAVELARDSVAALIGAPPETIAFTSGATESVNWALKGLMTHPGQTRRRIVTVATEHSCVLESADYLASLGAQLTVLPVRSDGRLDSDDFARAMGDDVALVSVMLVNNEIGTIQDIAAIAAVAHSHGAVMHCDAAQAFGKIPIDVDALGIDLLSLTAHKIYGPKGVGALYRRPYTMLTPLLHGGGQEDGRSGTLPTALIAGLGAAARIAGERMAADTAHALALRNRLLAGLTVPYTVNGDLAARWPGNLNLGFPGVGVPLLADLPGLALSSGSACAAVTGRPSHVLKALGLSDSAARASLRLGFGRFTTAAEIDAAAQQINAAVARRLHEAA
ncbi:MAG: hypothetical protein RL490_1126 [Pseudomonadota bacterium]